MRSILTSKCLMYLTIVVKSLTHSSSLCLEEEIIFESFLMDTETMNCVIFETVWLIVSGVKVQENCKCA